MIGIYFANIMHTCIFLLCAEWQKEVNYKKKVVDSKINSLQYSPKFCFWFNINSFINNNTINFAFDWNSTSIYTLLANTHGLLGRELLEPRNVVVTPVSEQSHSNRSHFKTPSRWRRRRGSSRRQRAWYALGNSGSWELISVFFPQLCIGNLIEF